MQSFYVEYSGDVATINTYVVIFEKSWINIITKVTMESLDITYSSER